ncbi:hypothetical protein [Butyrivibrio sp. AD3002]|uniref:hypothetical protein n=1 Tax=Butyrivibrio sp. AD3002 TaxID=1280670 RepID=UPI0012DF056E|nr:hypothetical protein [Butyrivibrio sp. AD3002]
MATCTAPINGHRTESGRANCHVCGKRGYGYRTYREYRPYYSYSGYGTGVTRKKISAPWSPVGSGASYTYEEVRSLTPIRNSVVQRASNPEYYDVFLCHVWDDRKECAKCNVTAKKNAITG